MMNFSTSSQHEEKNNLVSPDLGCPTCGECDVDNLFFNEDYPDTIDCQTCGARYTLIES